MLALGVTPVAVSIGFGSANVFILPLIPCPVMLPSLFPLP